MKRQDLFLLSGAVIFAFVLAGCVVRSYPVTKDRIDQDLTGNRGYIQGQAPAEEVKERKSTRTTQVVEIELHSPLRFEKAPKPTKIETTSPMLENEEQTSGNKGYITSSVSPEIAEPYATEKYTVQKGDTLQKISKKYYGTTKKWKRIYEANKDTMKGPNKIYRGQVINVPVEKESLKETEKNLK